VTIPNFDAEPLGTLLDLTGRVAVVTGGAMGIGYGIARRLREAGATVVIADRDEAAAREAVVRLGESCEAIIVDVSDEAAIEHLFGAVSAAHGGVDILVNNAGVYPMTPVLGMPTEEWDRVQSVNLRGVFLCSRAAGRQMVARGQGGVIVNVASMDAYHPTAIGLAHYDASKGGVVMFTKALALELAPHAIRVVAVAPGNIRTEGVARMEPNLPDTELAKMAGAAIERRPLGREGTPDDVARVVLFLVSDLAAYITGTTILVDGGYLLA
jgi:2-deoxy-D-gluconate 3-dehydrogenase